MVKYYENRTASQQCRRSLTIDLGCDSARRQLPTTAMPRRRPVSFAGFMLTNRLWFRCHDLFGFTVGGVSHRHSPGATYCSCHPSTVRRAFSAFDLSYFTRIPAISSRPGATPVESSNYSPSATHLSPRVHNRRRACLLHGPRGLTPPNCNRWPRQLRARLEALSSAHRGSAHAGPMLIKLYAMPPLV